MRSKNRQISEHTAKLSSRRRALFPTESSLDSGLGCSSPLPLDSDSDTETWGNIKTNVFTLNSSVGDYDIIGIVKDTCQDTIDNTPKNTPLLEITNENTPSLTIAKSPTQNLKTPHDIANYKPQLPKLIRKDTLLSNETPDILSDNIKSSKVRTALFPEVDMSLPSLKFYPKSNIYNTNISLLNSKLNKNKKSSRKKDNLFLCNRSRKNKRRFGQINAGVGHKVKKMKSRRPTKEAIMQAALNILENSPLNDILNKPTTIPESSPSPSNFINPGITNSVPENTEIREPSPEPDPTKKFFKSSRHKAVITLNDNIKLQYNNGKMSLIGTNKRPNQRDAAGQSCAKRLKLGAGDDFDSENEPLLPLPDVSSIINILEKEDNKENAPEASILLSPTSQMCNMTSDLVLNSPTKQVSEDKNRYFSVFYPGKTVFPKRPAEPIKTQPKRIKGLAKNQMLLDAGQKKFGATQCPECHIIYHRGDPSDELMHLNYHEAKHIFRFGGWRNERVVFRSMPDDRIIQVLPNDPKMWWKKIKDLMEVVCRDLGYDDQVDFSNSQVFLYIKSRTIVGVLAAHSIHCAYKLLSSHETDVDLCSEETYSVKCGVSRIWVSKSHRKKGYGTALMHALRKNFMYGSILTHADIAFSSPTASGKLFGASYFKTPNFLIYLN